MPKILTSVVLLILGCSVGYATHSLRYRTPTPEPSGKAVSTAEESQASQGIAEASAQFVPNINPLAQQDALRSIVRGELTQVLDDRAKVSVAANQAKEDEETADVTPSPGNLTAYDRGKNTVEAGIRNGRWTDTERTQLQDALVSMTPDMREDLMHSIIVAANDGRIKVETRGPLF